MKSVFIIRLLHSMTGVGFLLFYCSNSHHCVNDDFQRMIKQSLFRFYGPIVLYMTY